MASQPPVPFLTIWDGYGANHVIVRRGSVLLGLTGRSVPKALEKLAQPRLRVGEASATGEPTGVSSDAEQGRSGSLCKTATPDGETESLCPAITCKGIQPNVATGSASALKTATFLVIAVLTNSFGNLLLALAMDRLPSFSGTPLLHYLYLAVANPYLVPGTVLSAMYMVAQLSLFSWADLSFVIPVIASSYAVTAFLSEFVLGEHVQMERWIGVILISIGVALVARTPTTTKPRPTVETEEC